LIFAAFLPFPLLAKKFTEELLAHDDIREGFAAIVNGYVAWANIDQTVVEERSHFVGDYIDSISWSDSVEEIMLPEGVDSLGQPIAIILHQESAYESESSQETVLIFEEKTREITERVFEVVEGKEVLEIAEERIEEVEEIIEIAIAIPEGSVFPFVALSELEKGVTPIILEVVSELPENVIEDIKFRSTEWRSNFILHNLYTNTITHNFFVITGTIFNFSPSHPRITGRSFDFHVAISRILRLGCASSSSTSP
jgi:hypothetical protein